MLKPSAPLLFLALLAVCIGYGEAQSCTYYSQRVQCGELTCNTTSHRCMPCTMSAQCYETALFCNAAQRCALKPMSDNLRPGLFIAVVGAILVCSIAVVAGVGGGGILVPLYIWLLDVPMVTAVALSQATIAGQSSFNVMLICRRTHPDYPPPFTRSVINYEYLSLILPISLAGTLIGSAGSRVAADWMRVVLLYLILTNVLVRVVQRVQRQLRFDMVATTVVPPSPQLPPELPEAHPTAQTALAAPSVVGVAPEDANINEPQAIGRVTLTPESSLSKTSSISTGSIGAAAAASNAADAGSKLRWRQFPPFEVGMCAASFLILLAANVIRQLLTKCGSSWYWVAFGTPIALVVMLYFVSRRHYQRKWELVKVGKLPIEVIPFKWSFRTVTMYPLIAVTAGGAASMLGIGGGLVLSFLLLEAGLVPEEASSTGGMATMLVAVESALLFVVQRQLPVDYGMLFFVAGAVSTAIGQFVFVREIKRRGWKFLIILCLGLIVGGSMAALTAYGISNTVTLVRNHGYLGFGEYCKAT